MIDVMQWVDPNPDDNPENGATLDDRAIEIVDWINANSGQARYERAWAAILSQEDARPARIVIRSQDKGWIKAKPGDSVIMGSHWFHGDGTSCDGVHCRPALGRKIIRSFHITQGVSEPESAVTETEYLRARLERLTKQYQDLYTAVEGVAAACQTGKSITARTIASMLREALRKSRLG